MSQARSREGDRDAGSSALAVGQARRTLVRASSFCFFSCFFSLNFVFFYSIFFKEAYCNVIHKAHNSLSQAQLSGLRPRH